MLEVGNKKGGISIIACCRCSQNGAKRLIRKKNHYNKKIFLNFDQSEGRSLKNLGLNSILPYVRSLTSNFLKHFSLIFPWTTQFIQYTVFHNLGPTLEKNLKITSHKSYRHIKLSRDNLKRFHNKLLSWNQNKIFPRWLYYIKMKFLTELFLFQK